MSCVDEDGVELRRDEVFPRLDAGDAYEVTAPTLDGYEFVRWDDTSAPMAGAMTDPPGGLVVVLVYRAIPVASDAEASMRKVGAHSEWL